MAEPGLLIRSLSQQQYARNFHSFVISEIGTGIGSGSFAIGSILPGDAELMDRYGVSRTVLREALKTLEAKGLVEARAKVGTRVLPRHRWNLFDRHVLYWIFHAPDDPGFLADLTVLRQDMERRGAALAARGRQADQVRMMRYWINQLQLSADSPENGGLATFEIHRQVAEASQNVFLRTATGLSEFAIALAIRARMRRGESDLAGEKVPLFERLAARIDAGQAEEAGAVMAEITAIDAAWARPGG